MMARTPRRASADQLSVIMPTSLQARGCAEPAGN